MFILSRAALLLLTKEFKEVSGSIDAFTLDINLAIGSKALFVRSCVSWFLSLSLAHCVKKAGLSSGSMVVIIAVLAAFPSVADFHSLLSVFLISFN